MDIDNPYSAPTAKIDDKINVTSDMEQIRRDNIRHEVSLKSVGTLYGLGAAMMGIASLAILIPFFSGDANIMGENPILFGGMLLFYGVMSAILFAMAYGFRKLLPWVKIPGTLLAGVGLLGIPIGTLINGYILYLIWCKQGQTVLGAGYQDIVRATPHVKYQRTVGDKIAMGIVIALLVGVAMLLVSTMISK